MKIVFEKYKQQKLQKPGIWCAVPPKDYDTFVTVAVM